MDKRRAQRKTSDDVCSQYVCLPGTKYGKTIEGTMLIQEDSFSVRPVGGSDLDAVLDIYRQCEDFLALGPEPRASMQMVLNDIDHSRAENGDFCGIYHPDGMMMGILDVVPRGFEGNPGHAFLSLLMIAAPFRNAGLGTRVVRALEREILKDDQIEAILSVRSGQQTGGDQVLAAQRLWHHQQPRIHAGSNRRISAAQAGLVFTFLFHTAFG
jgi:ribosomal protein S18 acetylase RimI-like enzyme